MIFDEINQTINEMKKLKKSEDIENNKKQQEIIDQKYSKTLHQIDQLIKLIVILNKNFDFKLSENMYIQLTLLVNNSKNTVISEFADKTLVDNLETDYETVLDQIKKEWKNHYISITSGTIKILKIVSNIDSIQVNDCIQKIRFAETWNTDIKIYNNLKTALEESKNIINRLNLNNEIIDFLQKMNSGKATIFDLNEKVFTWITKNSLDKKIKLSLK